MSSFKVTLIVLIVTIFGVCHICAQDPMSKVEIAGEISMMIPQEFVEMNAQDIRNKFISYRPPKGGYTTIDRKVDLVVNVNPTPWMDQDIALLKEFYKNNIRNLFDEVEFLQEEVKEINGRSYAVFEFVSTVKGLPNSIKNQSAVVDYTWVQYTIKDQQAYVFTFHCGARLKDRWRESAAQTMSSIKFK